MIGLPCVVHNLSPHLCGRDNLTYAPLYHCVRSFSTINWQRHAVVLCLALRDNTDSCRSVDLFGQVSYDTAASAGTGSPPPRASPRSAPRAHPPPSLIGERTGRIRDATSETGTVMRQRFSALELHLVQAPVQAVLSQQFVLLALFHDPALVDDIDDVGALDRR